MSQTRRHLGAIICVVAINMIVFVFTIDKRDRSLNFSDSGDAICGPRCISYLIWYYKKQNTDLLDLIKEVQWPDFDNGTSLKDLKIALEKREIKCKIIYADNLENIKWNYPCIIHFNTSSAIGHYVIRMPASNETTTLAWMGVTGILSGPTSEFYKKSSGYILLTSTEDITCPLNEIFPDSNSAGFLKKLSRLIKPQSMVAKIFWLLISALVFGILFWLFYKSVPITKSH